MKFSILSSLALIAADEAMNGWSVNCRVNTDKPAYLASVETQQGTDLYWSVFKIGLNPHANIAGTGPLDADSDNFCDKMTNTTDILIEDPSIIWTNDINPVPEEVFGKGYISTALGFALFNAYDGCIIIADMNQPSKSSFPINNNDWQIITGGCGFEELSNDPKYYYFTAKWFDMDNDGDLDLVTGRAQGQTDPLDLTSSDLVWLENEGRPFEAGNNVWKTHVIKEAHDISDTWLDIWSDGTNIYVITGGLASQQLILLQSPNFSDADSIIVTKIDNDGRYFYQQFEDLNLDGIPDVVVTIGSYGEQYGKVVVYPGQIVDGIYSLGTKVTVDYNFPNMQSKAVTSPGFAYKFWYNTQDKDGGKLPSLMVSGQNDGMMYMVDPVANGDNFNFEYTVQKIYITKPLKKSYKLNPSAAPAVGKPLIMDINGDGCNEIIVCGYFSNQIVILEQDACI